MNFKQNHRIFKPLENKVVLLLKQITLTMKKIKILSAIALFVFGTIFIQSCNEEQILPITDDKTILDISDTDLSADDMVLAMDYLLDNPEYTDASEETDLAATDDGVPLALTDVEFDVAVTDRLTPAATARCKNIWAAMGLSQGQKDSIRRAHSAYIKCKGTAATALKRIYRSYLSKAAVERKKLIDAYKNGRITRAVLKVRLDALNKRVKTAIRNDARIARLRAQLKKCHTSYVRMLHSVLTPAQWRMYVKCKRFLYKRAKARHKTGSGKTKTP